MPGDGPFLADRLAGHQRIAQPGDGGDHDLVSRSPVTGWAVNATPAATGSTITCTRTAIAAAPPPCRSGVRRDPLGASSGETPPHRVAPTVDRHIQKGLVQAGVRRVGRSSAAPEDRTANRSPPSSRARRRRAPSPSRRRQGPRPSPRSLAARATRPRPARRGLRPCRPPERARPQPPSTKVTTRAASIIHLHM